MKQIVLECKCRTFKSERTIVIPPLWTARPLHRALQKAFGWENDHAFWFKRSPTVFCSGNPVDNTESRGVSFADPLERLFPGIGSRLLYVYDGGDENEVVLVRREDAEGDKPACLSASGLMAVEDSSQYGYVDGIADDVRKSMADGHWDRIPEEFEIGSRADAEAWLRDREPDLASISRDLAKIPFRPESDCYDPPERNEMPFFRGFPGLDRNDDEEILDGKDVSDEIFLANAPRLPPDPVPLAELAHRAEAGDRAALVELADRSVRYLHSDADECRDLPVILRGLFRAVAEGDVAAKASAGRLLVSAYMVPARARLRGWLLLREAADAGIAAAWDALGRQALDWILVDGSYSELEKIEPDRSLLPRFDDLKDFAVSCFRNAVENGCPSGWNGLFWAAEEGIGTPSGNRDPGFALECALKGAEAGDSHSSFHAGFKLLDSQDGTDEDILSCHKRGLELVLQGAEAAAPDMDDAIELANRMDDWRKFGRVADHSVSARRCDAAMARINQIDNDFSGRRSSEVEEENRKLRNAWINAFSVLNNGPDPALEEGRRLLSLPDATPKQLREGFRLVRESAERNGSAAVWRELASCYETGRGIYRNKNRARDCIKNAERVEARLAAAAAFAASPPESDS